MPSNGKPELPSPGEYEKLRRAANELRQAPGVEEHKQEARLDQQRAAAKYLRYTGMGMQFLLMMGLPTALGYWLDAKLATTPWLLLSGAALGMTGAMVFVVRTVGRLEGGGKGGKP